MELSNEYVIDTDTVETIAGTYTVQYVQDVGADQPFDDGFGLIMPATRRRYGIDVGSIPRDVERLVVVALSDRDDKWYWERRSGAAIVRYLRLKGVPGATLVDELFRPEKNESTDRDERYAGIAWAPADATNPDEYVESMLETWRAWADGDVFGYVVTAPDGTELDDSVWGFYGFDRERDYVADQARDAIEDDVERRTAAASLVGAGFVGLI